MNKIISEVKSLLALILIVLILKETVIELYIVPTTSMERNILKGDMLVGSRFAYGMKVPQKIWVPFTAISIPTFLPEYRFPAFKKVERGDVVVFEYPRDIVYKYVKRCIGLPGDTISIQDREVYVNGNVSVLPDGGQFLMDTYMSSDIIDDEIFLGVSGNKDQYPEITIPKKGDIFTLDESMNWKFLLPIILYEGNSVELIYQEQKFNFTNDSPRDIFRRTGDRSVFKDYVPTEGATLINPWSPMFKKEYIKYLYINGKPITDIDSYIVKQDYFWMMGDNRDNSEDSRYWGFVPESHILGQPVITWFSINLDNYFPRIARIGKIPN
ncbi:MAG: signal peptidase I [Candidatus Marinimicrobia bacterium]|jgi:signal peptidase I|nr:signal peptidase I [Candidatus Neomarinimicrobiota bacterium]